MKLITLVATCLYSLVFAFSVQAETEPAIPLSGDEILGNWSVDAESLHRSGEGSRRLDTIWTFNPDGTMIGESIDSQQHTRLGKMRAVVKYKLENGLLIRQMAPGRSKQEACKAVEKSGKKLVLKCTSVYFFMTKQ
jgi:hypothetical protein